AGAVLSARATIRRLLQLRRAAVSRTYTLQRRLRISAVSSRATSPANSDARDIWAGERPLSLLSALGAASASLRPCTSSSQVSSPFALRNAKSRTPLAWAWGVGASFTHRRSLSDSRCLRVIL